MRVVLDGYSTCRPDGVARPSGRSRVGSQKFVCIRPPMHPPRTTRNGPRNSEGRGCGDRDHTGRVFSRVAFLYSLSMAYPVSVSVEPLLANRNRLTTAFRLILAIPHLILAGGVGLGIASRGDNATAAAGEAGLIGAAAFFLAIVSWFTIVIGGTHIAGIRGFTSFYLRWRVRALAYLMLLEDAYPPFGDGPYPAAIEIVDPAGPRDRVTVALRILLAIPQFVVLFFVLLAWCFTTIAAWFIILFTGSYPQGLYGFGVGALRWLLRVQAYLLLLVDDYPPFSLA